MAHKDKTVLNHLAKLAADTYMRNQKASTLQSELTKIAKQEGVLPIQIEYLTSAANQEVWKQLYGMNKQASYAFHPVDPAAVLGSLQKASPHVVKKASEDYLSPPKPGLTKTAATAKADVVGVIKVGYDAEAAGRRQLRRDLQERLEKVSAARDEFDRKLYVLDSDIESTEAAFVKSARTLIIEAPFLEREFAMDKIAEFVRSAAPKRGKRTARLMAKLSDAVAASGLIKKAALKAPEAYISEKLPARVVNGNHVLYILIEGLAKKWDERDIQSQGREICDSTLPSLKEKIRAL